MKLNPEQRESVADIRRAKDTYDRLESKLDEEYRAKKEALKNPVRAAVAKADSLGVPKRQIHRDGLGFEQANSMNNFLMDRRKTLSEQLWDVLTPTTPAQEGYQIMEVMPGVYSLAGFDKEILISDGDEDNERLALIEGLSADEWPEWVHEAIDNLDPDIIHGYEGLMTSD